MRLHRALLLSAIMGLAFAVQAADDPTQHLITPETQLQSHTALENTDARLEQAATQYADYAPVPRIALFDMAWPSSPAEYASLDGFGVLLVTVVSQRKDELPPKRVYVHVDGKAIELKLFKSGFATSSGNDAVRRVLGSFRWDGLYYYPVYLPFKGSDLSLDFAKDRDGFVLDRYQAGEESAPDNLQGVTIAQPHGAEPPADAFQSMVRREYPGLIELLDTETKADAAPASKP